MYLASQLNAAKSNSGEFSVALNSFVDCVLHAGSGSVVTPSVVYSFHVSLNC